MSGRQNSKQKRRKKEKSRGRRMYPVRRENHERGSEARTKVEGVGTGLRVEVVETDTRVAVVGTDTRVEGVEIDVTAETDRAGIDVILRNLRLNRFAKTSNLYCSVFSTMHLKNNCGLLSIC